MTGLPADAESTAVPEALVAARAPAGGQPGRAPAHRPALSPDFATVMETGQRLRTVPVSDPVRTGCWTRFFAAQQPW